MLESARKSRLIVVSLFLSATGPKKVLSHNMSELSKAQGNVGAVSDDVLSAQPKSTKCNKQIFEVAKLLQWTLAFESSSGSNESASVHSISGMK